MKSLIFALMTVLSMASAHAAENVLESGETLHPGEALVSPNGQYNLVMQWDGNLVLYNHGHPLWSTGTHNVAIEKAVMQGDGNFVLYRYDSVPAWASHTVVNDGGKNSLVLQNDGNLVIYKTSTSAVWATGTQR